MFLLRKQWILPLSKHYEIKLWEYDKEDVIIRLRIISEYFIIIGLFNGFILLVFGQLVNFTRQIKVLVGKATGIMGR